MAGMKTLLACIALVLAVPACGSDPGAEPSSAVAGTVSVGSCPVTGPDAPPCELETVGGVLLVVYDSSGEEVASGTSDDAGSYRIPLSPGPYTLVPRDVPPPALDTGKPIEFRVRADATTSLDVVLDSGVR
jgi:hypothetical protein